MTSYFLISLLTSSNHMPNCNNQQFDIHTDNILQLPFVFSAY